MKKLALIFTGILVGVGMTAFAATTGFLDQDQFSEWYRDAVRKVNEMGVMKGYPDGNFRPGNAVNRAELAVSLAKYDQYETGKFYRLSDRLFAANLLDFMSAQEKFSELAIPFHYKKKFIIAETGLMRLDKKPDISRYSRVENDENFPEGYSLYEQHGIVFSYYIHYKGSRLFEDMEEEVDEWYGPF